MVRPAYVVALLVALAAAPARAASVLPTRMGMYTQQGQPFAMLESKVVVRVRGPIIEATVTQTFKNDLDRVTEATYIFPLPVDAAVSAMEIETGARTIRASIEPREQAQQRYESAVAAGVGAALLDQERPDIFTQTVSAIPAKGTVTVTLRYDAVARYQSGKWELVLPMVVAPRYVPGSASGRPTTGTGRAPDTDRAPDASRVTPGGAPGAGGKTEVEIDLADAVDDVTSPTHDLTKLKGGYRFVDAKSDHDAVIRWHAKVPAAGWVESSDDGGYAAVVVEAPAPAARKGSLRVMLVLDRAATTRGDADAMKRPIVRALLDALTSKDSVAVTGIDKIDWRAPDQAWRALDDQWAKQGKAFDISATLAATRTNGAPVVMISDGLVTDDRAVLEAARKVGAPIHVIGIGPAPNRGLLTSIAATTGGTLRFAIVGDDPAQLARDVLADVATQPEPLAINWGSLAASEVVPAALPRLGAGQAMLVLAKVKKVQTANARVRGDVFGFVTVSPSRPPDGATTPRGALARRWAKLKLDELVVAANPKPIIDHAMKFGLVSPYTSMVAIGDEVVVKGGVKHSVPIAVSVPEGMKWQLVKKEIQIDTTISPADEQQKLGKLKKGEKTRDTKQDKSTLAEKKERPKTEPPPEPKPEPTKKAPVAKTPPRAKDQTRPEKPTESREPIAQPRSPGAGAGNTQSTTVAQPPPPAPVTPTSPPPAVDFGGYGGEDEEDAEPRSRDQGRDSVASGAMAPSIDDGESEALMEVSSVRSRRRLSLSLGAGLTIVNGEAAPHGALSGRLELGRRTMYGVEGSLWLVDGPNAQGSVLATLTFRGIARRLELGFGSGLRITGDAAGPAFNVTLRTRLPIRPLATYLRYDGALLLHDGTYDGQNAASLGLEASF